MNTAQPDAPAAGSAASLPTWPDWWAAPGVLQRFVADLVADELAQLRPGASLPPRPWPATLALDADGLGLDSMERLSVATALAETLHLHESGLEDLLLVRRSLDGWVALADEALRCHGSQLTFRTSGSSGQPKPCTHTLAALQQEVDHLASVLGGVQRVRAAVPAHHIYGFLFTVLLPLRLGVAPADDVRSTNPAGLVRQLAAGDLLVSHPAHWALLARPGAVFPAGVQGTSSTAPCPDALAQALVGQGLQRLLQVYGSSETAGIGWRDAPGAPYRLMPHWQRDADDPARLWRLAPAGQRLPALLQDRLAWADDGRFQVAGRLDAAVQVNGQNVFPDRVRQALCRHPAVADAAVRLMRPDEGQRLKAFIVPVDGADLDHLRQQLPAWLQPRLSAAEQPKAWRFGPRLPVNERGKACDWPAAEPTDGCTA